MNIERIKKLEKVSKKLIWNYIFEQMWDSEYDFWVITVTYVKISSDLSYLDIFVSCLLKSELLTKKLAKNNRIIQSKLNKVLNIRKLPKIRFRYDNSGAIWQNICNVISNIV